MTFVARRPTQRVTPDKPSTTEAYWGHPSGFRRIGSKAFSPPEGAGFASGSRDFSRQAAEATPDDILVRLPD